MRLTTTTTTSDFSNESEFLASEHFTAFPVTLDASQWTADADGDKKVISGTVLGKVTASGLYGPYDGAAADGTETAVCISLNTINLKDGNATIAAVFQGAVYEDRLTGLDAAGKTELAPHFLFRSY